MPKVYRTMKREGDLPVVEDSRYGLGAREPVDVQPDSHRKVYPGKGGMSVMPSRFPPIVSLIPRRLKDTDPRYAGATGAVDSYIFCMGDGPFLDGNLTPDLHLRVDSKRTSHGFVEPQKTLDVEVYRAALATTREQWAVCEGDDAP